MKFAAHSTETLNLAKILHATHEKNVAAGQTDEFPADASIWPADLSRRRFIQLMGASLALAGVGGCNRVPSKEIVPYAIPPEAGQGAEALYYASAFSWEGFARGILVAAHTGRPTKIEGNPQHPDSLGAADTITQASILALYDPDRSKSPRHKNEPSSWQAFDRDWSARRAQLLSTRGQGLALLTEPTTSPTFLRLIHSFLDAFPEAHWYQHTPLVRYDRNGTQLDYDFAKAEIILTVEADVFYQHPSAIRYSRAFTARRKVVNGQARPSRLYTIESSPSITGSMADVRLPASPTRWPAILNALADQIVNNQAANGSPGASLSPEETEFVSSIAKDLLANAPNILCVIDASLPEEFHVFADAIHSRLGARGVTVFERPAVRSDGDPRSAGDLPALTDALANAEISDLLILDCNPVYTAGDNRFETALRGAPFSLHLGSYFDETAAACTWHLPQNHYLEAWGDLRAFDGTISMVQPLIEPLYETASPIELLRRLSPLPGANGYQLVRENWEGTQPNANFDDIWRRWLDRGLIGESAEKIKPVSAGGTPAFAPLRGDASLTDGVVTVIYKPDPNIVDGRWSNNAWLQELPKPFTHLVWDNAILISSAFAKRHGLENGAEIALTIEKGHLVGPVWIVPGHADNCLTLYLGYGRTHVGVVGAGHGFDVYRARAGSNPWFAAARKFASTGGSQTLVSTHSHFSMEGRDLAKTISLAELPEVKREQSEFPSMYPKWDYQSYAWGMSIDLSVCTGCNACVIACQAENNIPVVGKDQVARGREMHWIRIDRYYEGNVANPRILQQPVPCMHCEKAPCELVCPVGATVHSSEGLNDMVYNRCVGTRYCSNNCPYKVRRFNFFDYREPPDSPVYLQKNPNVTVRERGVMEKCTYCVQRINAGRIRAERENRKIRDGEVVTACQQACPVEAIAFGDINDPVSRVSLRKKEQTDYSLLAELNTRPRTTYLTRILNVEGEPKGVRA